MTDFVTKVHFINLNLFFFKKKNNSRFLKNSVEGMNFRVIFFVKNNIELRVINRLI